MAGPHQVPPGLPCADRRPVSCWKDERNCGLGRGFQRPPSKRAICCFRLPAFDNWPTTRSASSGLREAYAWTTRSRSPPALRARPGGPCRYRSSDDKEPPRVRHVVERMNHRRQTEFFKKRPVLGKKIGHDQNPRGDPGLRAARFLPRHSIRPAIARPRLPALRDLDRAVAVGVRLDHRHHFDRVAHRRAAPRENWPESPTSKLRPSYAPRQPLAASFRTHRSPRPNCSVLHALHRLGSPHFALLPRSSRSIRFNHFREILVRKRQSPRRPRPRRFPACRDTTSARRAPWLRSAPDACRRPRSRECKRSSASPVR